MTNQLAVSATLTNEKVQFTGVAQSNPAITIDYTPPLGDGQGYMPLELLLISLAACSGSTVATLLRRFGKTVAGLEVKALGVRRQDHPTSFERILLEFKLSSPDAADADLQKAIQLSEETVCPVWAMLKNNVEIGWEYSISAG
jgi:putative redox protein